MTNTAVHHIVQKSSSLLVIARCRSEAAKINNTQGNQPMCIDIFLYRLGAAERSARWMSASRFAGATRPPVASTPRCMLRSQTATTRSGSLTASALARWTASAPRGRRKRGTVLDAFIHLCGCLPAGQVPGGANCHVRWRPALSCVRWRLAPVDKTCCHATSR
jgi:hypothetical protein